ncbi:MAG: hypothetical protein RLY87_2163 [Chloroflexota bacterium]|jgi:hypothetical protein
MSEPRAKNVWMRQRRLLRRLLPHLVTMVTTIVVSWLWFGRTPQAALTEYVVPRTTATPRAMQAIGTPTAVVVVPADITRQELLDVNAQTNALWSAVYVSRAQLHVADLEAAIALNDVVQAQQLLLSLDDALAMAEQVAPAEYRDPIAQLRLDAIAMRQDLFSRPDGIAARIQRIRQALVPLIGAPSAGR